VNARIPKRFQDPVVFHCVKAQGPTPEQESLPVKEAEPPDRFYRCLHIRDALDRPVLDHTPDDIRVVSVYPVRKPVGIPAKSIWRSVGAEA